MQVESFECTETAAEPIEASEELETFETLMKRAAQIRREAITRACDTVVQKLTQWSPENMTDAELVEKGETWAPSCYID